MWCDPWWLFVLRLRFIIPIHKKYPYIYISHLLPSSISTSLFLFILYVVERSSWLFNVQFFSSWILICFCDNDANTLHYTVWTQKNKVILQFHILLAIHFNLFHLSAWFSTSPFLKRNRHSHSTHFFFHHIIIIIKCIFFSQTLQKYSLLLPLQPLVLLV